MDKYYKINNNLPQPVIIAKFTARSQNKSILVFEHNTTQCTKLFFFTEFDERLQNLL